MVTRAEKGEGEISNCVSGINRNILLYIYIINNKNLLYSTENYIQYLVITYNEKESENNIYIYMCACVCVYT